MSAKEAFLWLLFAGIALAIAAVCPIIIPVIVVIIAVWLFVRS